MSVKINIGGGKHCKRFPRGWIIMDKGGNHHYKINLNNDIFPIESNSVDAVYTSHTLEHIYADAVPRVFLEINRILKQGGLFRIVVPDIDVAVKLYTSQQYDALRNISDEVAYKQAQLPDFPICILSSWFYTYKHDDGPPFKRYEGGHTMAFNFDLLEYYMVNAGFKRIKKLACNVCSSVFNGCDFANYADGSLYVEACK